MSQAKDGRGEETGMEAAERQTGEELPERWSARAKTEIVLRLLKGAPPSRVRCCSSSVSKLNDMIVFASVRERSPVARHCLVSEWQREGLLNETPQLPAGDHR